jgi:hypothetical protein
MSIKAVHVLFIVLAAAVSFGFGVWGIRSGQHLVLASASLAAGGALVVYGILFLRKMKAYHIS